MLMKSQIDSTSQYSYKLLQQKKRTFPLNIFHQKLLESYRNSSKILETKKSKQLPKFLIDILDEPIPFKRRANSLVKDYISASQSISTSRANLPHHRARLSQPSSFYQYDCDHIPKIAYQEYSAEHTKRKVSSRSKKRIYDDYFEGGERNGQNQSRIYRPSVVHFTPKTKIRVFSAKPINLDKSKGRITPMDSIDLRKSFSSVRKNSVIDIQKQKFRPALQFMDKVMRLNEVSCCNLNLDNLNSSIM